LSSLPNEDISRNHTLTIKYKTRSFLQAIGRIPVDKSPKEDIKEVKIEGGNGDRAVSPDFVEVGGKRYYKKEELKREREPSPEYVEIDGKRYKRVNDDASLKSVKKEERPMALKVKDEKVLFIEVDGVIEID
jgi:hypothetical protein